MRPRGTSLLTRSAQPYPLSERFALYAGPEVSKRKHVRSGYYCGCCYTEHVQASSTSKIRQKIGRYPPLLSCRVWHCFQRPLGRCTRILFPRKTGRYETSATFEVALRLIHGALRMLIPVHQFSS
ncbi:hypothetical protein BC835DRAFT_993343 [Cytidiella melzeri]|nr:hypothetical protein BC835DRAFT_993343 [Cytidiella melzeri]